MSARNHIKTNHPKQTITKVGNYELKNHWHSEQETIDRTEFLKSDIFHAPHFVAPNTNKAAGGRFQHVPLKFDR
jgi:hypothetical protein